MVSIPGFHPVQLWRAFKAARTITRRLNAGEITEDQLVKAFVDAGCKVTVTTTKTGDGPARDH